MTQLTNDALLEILSEDGWPLAHNMRRVQMKRLTLALWLLLALAGIALAQAPSWTRSSPATSVGYPPNSQPFTASATGTTSATVTVTQPAAYTNAFVCHIEMTESGGTAISAAGSLTHTVGGVTVNFAQLGQLVANFNPCLPNDGSNMVATTPTATGATNSALTVTGYFY
jgi:hypothetical protein